MDHRELAGKWLDLVEDAELHAELDSMLASDNDQAIEDAFFQDLAFGTAGLRGIIGAGTNRMNVYTVGRATQGLANYINAQCPTETPSVAIARDSRHKGEEFVKHTASILAANGIRTLIYPRVEPTPALSFAVRHLGCFAGICMTASHNPANYNGYKVYGSDGCQITSEAAYSISNQIEAIDPFTQVKSMDFEDALAEGLVSWIDDAVLEAFNAALVSFGLEKESSRNCALSLVYTPLCGSGWECFERMAHDIGLGNIALVPEQSEPNGDFPTCTYPNPEEKEALEEGIALAEELEADLLLATDPDADRVGIAIAKDGGYILPTGNEVGVLLFDYLCRMHLECNSMPKQAVAISTIVSTAMIDPIAREYGVEVMRTLTGFKYIGDIISDLEARGEASRFLFGFEESYGYLAGTHVRDKDAIVASMLICQMARSYKSQGITLCDALESLYRKYGYYANRTINIAFPGAEGAVRMQTLMERMRAEKTNCFAGRGVEEILDYQPGICGLPPANVVEYRLAEEQKLVFRPSGTEPKLKVYLFSKSDSRKRANQILDELEIAARELVEA